MNELKLLIVEDDEELIKSYKRDIRSFNLTSDVKIKECVINNKDDALVILEDTSVYFDAAIVDLRLDNKGGNDQDYSGNEVIRKIKSNLRFPVFVITGTPHFIDPDLAIQNSLFKIKTRGEEDNYLEQFIEIFNTGITNILSRKGIIEQYLNNIFWNHLSTSMDMWIDDTTRVPSEKERSLIRYTLLHMQEYIDEDIEKYHPSEFYITRPIKKNIFTGDIVSLGKDRYIILTPSCDIIIRAGGNRNADFIMLCKLKGLNDIVKNYNLLNGHTPINNDNRKRLNSFIENKNQKYHFIPKSKDFDAALIDFQDKLTFPQSDTEKLLETGEMIRLATVSSPFLKDIISRYSNYYSRQGSPDFNIEEIYNSLF